MNQHSPPSFTVSSVGSFVMMGRTDVMVTVGADVMVTVGADVTVVSGVTVTIGVGSQISTAPGSILSKSKSKPGAVVTAIPPEKEGVMSGSNDIFGDIFGSSVIIFEMSISGFNS